MYHMAQKEKKREKKEEKVQKVLLVSIWKGDEGLLKPLALAIRVTTICHLSNIGLLRMSYDTWKEEASVSSSFLSFFPSFHPAWRRQWRKEKERELEQHCATGDAGYWTIVELERGARGEEYREFFFSFSMERTRLLSTYISNNWKPAAASSEP